MRGWDNAEAIRVTGGNEISRDRNNELSRLGHKWWPQKQEEV